MIIVLPIPTHTFSKTNENFGYLSFFASSAVHTAGWRTGKQHVFLNSKLQDQSKVTHRLCWQCLKMAVYSKNTRGIVFVFGWTHIPSNVCYCLLNCRYSLIFPWTYLTQEAIRPRNESGSQAALVFLPGPHPDPLGLVMPSFLQHQDRTQFSTALILGGIRSKAGKGAKRDLFICGEKETPNNHKLLGRCKRDPINHKHYFEVVFPQPLWKWITLIFFSFRFVIFLSMFYWLCYYSCPNFSPFATLHPVSPFFPAIPPLVHVHGLYI